MSRYYDTGVLLKLYTEEPASDAVRAHVVRRGQPLLFTSLHLSECVSALQLKAFCGECTAADAAAAALDVEADLASGVLRRAGIDWEAAWGHCRILSAAHTAEAGCRTLDALHVACALQLGCREFVTSDARQSKLAAKAGLRLPKIA